MKFNIGSIASKYSGLCALSVFALVGCVQGKQYSGSDYEAPVDSGSMMQSTPRDPIAVVQTLGVGTSVQAVSYRLGKHPNSVSNLGDGQKLYQWQFTQRGNLVHIAILFDRDGLSEIQHMSKY